MRVLVTGGAGYIGSVITQKLLLAGHEVRVLDDFSSGHHSALPKNVDLIEASLLDDLTEAVAKVDAIIHCAGKSIVSESVEKPELYHRVNVEGSTNLIETAMRMNVNRFIFSSSAAVYAPSDELLTEESPTIPTNPYGQTKLVIDQLLLGAKFLGASFRYFNVAGAFNVKGRWISERHNPETHLIPNVLTATQSAPFRLFGDDWPTADGTCIRDYVHVEDLAEAHIAALSHSAFDVCNLGTGKGSSVKDVISKAERATGRKVPLSVEGPRMGDPAVLVASYAKANRLFGWSPQKSLEEMINSAATAMTQP